jgi:nucleoid-associated protein YgaU
MGILDFMKDAGEKLVEKGQEASLAKKIEERIGTLGVKVKGLEVMVKDDHVQLKGFPASPDDHEKALLIAGNVKGVAKVTDMMTAAKAGAVSARFHTVASGDTLSAISKKVYGDANKYMKIFEANKPMLSNPDKIYPGQVLRIPE